ncbi:hydroxyphenylacetyl-CoA thioesterase PaaI [uncultured Cohaesibacter sp.]|uniref:hydroxyphenylacetyl-CoA thioesterase PaaI n=1 Tax=uncultured Cohaesibacter sp. TaxID=1002546 RepID=UPI002AABCCE8|nr:hydroxyphenylacetyl-CoA thioesterase PaaI [uncultured Cohaesibacter sp.]
MDQMATMTPQELADACAQAMWDGDSTSQKLGMKLEHVAPGEAVLSMTVSEAMTNGHGNAHGGYLFTLADSAFAFACNTYNQITVAQNCTITFLAPGTLGDRLTASAHERSRSGRSGLYDVQVVREDGTIIAEFRGHARTVKGTLLSSQTVAKRDDV